MVLTLLCPLSYCGTAHIILRFQIFVRVTAGSCHFSFSGSGFQWLELVAKKLVSDSPPAKIKNGFSESLALKFIECQLPNTIIAISKKKCNSQNDKFCWFYIFFIVFTKIWSNFAKKCLKNKKITGKITIFTCDFTKNAFLRFSVFDFLTLSYSTPHFLKH